MAKSQKGFATTGEARFGGSPSKLKAKLIDARFHKTRNGGLTPQRMGGGSKKVGKKA